MIEDYVRNARLVRVIDGDTVVLDIDLGFGIWLLGRRVRVLGVNCPEVHGPTKDAGLAATSFTRRWFVQYAEHEARVQIRTQLVGGEDSFGRILADVEATDPSGVRNLATDLLAAGHGVPFVGIPSD